MKLTNIKTDLSILLLIVIGCLLALYLKPSAAITQGQSLVALERLIPTAFDDWEMVPTATISMDLYRKTEGERSTDNPYDDTLMRAYQNSKGEVVHLALAYGKKQQQDVKVHRPELCYYAQGFKVDALNDHQFSIKGQDQQQAINGKRMLVTNGDSQRAVSYWIRIGDIYSHDAWQTRLYLLQQGLFGHVPDGMLVRTSTAVESQHGTAAPFVRNDAFLSALMTALAPTAAQQYLTKPAQI